MISFTVYLHWRSLFTYFYCCYVVILGQLPGGGKFVYSDNADSRTTVSDSLLIIYCYAVIVMMKGVILNERCQ